MWVHTWNFILKHGRVVCKIKKTLFIIKVWVLTVLENLNKSASERQKQQKQQKKKR